MRIEDKIGARRKRGVSSDIPLFWTTDFAQVKGGTTNFVFTGLVFQEGEPASIFVSSASQNISQRWSKTFAVGEKGTPPSLRIEITNRYSSSSAAAANLSTEKK